MFNLLQTVSLNPFHQILHCGVLLSFESHRLTLHLLHHSLLVLIDLIQFLLIRLLAHELSVVVLLDSEKYLFLVSQSNEVFSWFVAHVVADFFE